MTYAYTHLETATASALGVSPAHQRGPFRARLQHFTRLGMPDIKTGKGRRIEYTYDHAVQWLIGLLLAEAGLDPTVIVAGIKQHWRSFAPAIAEATSIEARSVHPFYICARPRLMTSAWTRSSPAARPLSMEILQFRLSRGFAGPQHELVPYVEGAPDAATILINFTRPL